MTPLGIATALFAEGPSDHRFLDRLIERLLVNELSSRGLTVDVLPIQRLPPDNADARVDRILAGAQSMRGGFHLLFVHADAGGDIESACRQRIGPAREAILEAFPEGTRRIVGLVPKRETEAWALADIDALARVLATRADLVSLGVPENPRLVESLADPKAVLDTVVQASRKARRRRRAPRGGEFLDRLADEIRLSELERVPTFATVRRKLGVALTDLAFV